MPRFFNLDGTQVPVCRLGLATRGNTHLTRKDVLLALDRGLNYWNWCGHLDGMAEAIRELGSQRKRVLIGAMKVSALDSQTSSRIQKLLWLSPVRGITSRVYIPV